MSRLVEFGLEGGGAVLVEVVDTGPASTPIGPQRVSRSAEDAAQGVTQSFDALVGGIRPVARAILAQFKDLELDSAEVEFAVKLTANAGIILAGTAAEGSCAIKLTWKPGDRSA